MTTHAARWRVWLGLGLALILVCTVSPGAAASKPAGQMVHAIHFTLAPTFFHPSETTGITSFLFLYALHDALVKSMPGNPQAPSLAESWSESDDGLTYEFRLRQGVTFHNGDSLTAEDVKFSMERYRGVGAALFKGKVKAIEIVDALPSAPPPERALAGFYDVPWHAGNGRGVGCAQEVCRAGRRRRLQEASHRRWPV